MSASAPYSPPSKSGSTYTVDGGLLLDGCCFLAASLTLDNRPHAHPSPPPPPLSPYCSTGYRYAKQLDSVAGRAFAPLVLDPTTE